MGKSSQTEWSAYDSAQNCQAFIPFKSPSYMCQDSANFIYDPKNEYNFENFLNPVTKTENVSQSTNCAKNFKYGFDSSFSYQEYQTDKLASRVPTNRYQEYSPTNFYSPTYFFPEQSSSGADFQKIKSSSEENSQKTNKLLSLQSQKEKADSVDPFEFQPN